MSVASFHLVRAPCVMVICVILLLGLFQTSIMEVKAYYDGEALIPNPRSYGDLPDVGEVISTASDINSLGTISNPDLPKCRGLITFIGNGISYDFTITPDSPFCVVFVKTSANSQLVIDGGNGAQVNLKSCDAEYLYISDGDSIDSTMCEMEGTLFKTLRARYLFLQYERQPNLHTGTSFTIRVTTKPVHDPSEDAGSFKQLGQTSAGDSDQEQICKDCGFSRSRAGGSRVLGGTDAKEKEHPWMVGIHITLRNQVGTKIYTNCGGTILDRRHVLTAAHCVVDDHQDGTRLADVSVVAGTIQGFNFQRSDSKSQIIKVESWFSHPLFNYTSKERSAYTGGKSYDLSVLRLSELLTFNEYVKPICLSSPQSFLGSDVTVTGYGISPAEGNASRRLQRVKLNIRPAFECDRVYKRKVEGFQLQPHQICMFAPDKDACGGDSGGPAVLRRAGRFHQVGVVSFGLDCEKPQETTRHGVFVRVSSFFPWIKYILGKSISC